MNIIAKLLKKNISAARIAGFVLSNFIGLAIVTAAVQFYLDAGSIYDSDDSFIRKDYLVINKHITSDNSINAVSSAFSPDEIAELEKQPWVRKVGRFESSDYHVAASVQQGGRGMQTSMFFESIPSEFIDVGGAQWHYQPGSSRVPIIISKDYLALYNFGFAGSAGLPQISESIMGGIPLKLRVTSADGLRSNEFEGAIAGFSNRLNTILVPDEFMKWSNARFGSGTVNLPSRLIIDTNSPGDVAINRYLEQHNLEVAGDKSGSQAAFLVKIVTGIVIGIGAVITVLSLFILMLSISLLMEKNRDKLHTLLMLGCDLRSVGAPYRKLIIISCVLAWLLAAIAVSLMRLSYIAPLKEMGAVSSGIWQAPLVGLVMTALVTIFNLIAVKKKVEASWRL